MAEQTEDFIVIYGIHILMSIIVIAGSAALIIALISSSSSQNRYTPDGTATILETDYFKGDFLIKIKDANDSKNTVSIGYETFKEVEEGGKICFKNNQIINVGKCS